MYRNFFKRLFDFIVSLIGILLLSPIFLLIFISLLVANRGKPFFFQSRPGKNEKLFLIVKFKTMNDKKDEFDALLPDEKRLTKVGSLVRKSSMDEIPQLINVLKGDMSLIGPRPLLPEYISLYNEKQKRRHEVRPGITGWAQVNGRNNISWQKKFDLDVWYVDNLSFKTDIRILFLTIMKILKSEGVSQDGQATTVYFKGNDDK